MGGEGGGAVGAGRWFAGGRGVAVAAVGFAAGGAAVRAAVVVVVGAGWWDGCRAMPAGAYRAAAGVAVVLLVDVALVSTVF